MAAYAAHSTNQGIHFLTSKTNKPRATQKRPPEAWGKRSQENGAYLKENGGLGKKKSGEWGLP